MTKTIKSTINYEITIGEEGPEITEYNSEIDNDLAVLILAQYLMQNCDAGLRLEKKNLKGAEKKLISEEIDRVLKGINGLGLVIGMYIENYDALVERLKRNIELTIEKDETSKTIEELSDGSKED